MALWPLILFVIGSGDHVFLAEAGVPFKKIKVPSRPKRYQHISYTWYIYIYIQWIISTYVYISITDYMYIPYIYIYTYSIYIFIYISCIVYTYVYKQICICIHNQKRFTVGISFCSLSRIQKRHLGALAIGSLSSLGFQFTTGLPQPRDLSTRTRPRDVTCSTCSTCMLHFLHKKKIKKGT